MQTKQWYQSKTNWVQIAGVFATILGLVNQDLLVAIGVSNPITYVALVQFISQGLTLLIRNFDTATPIANPFREEDFNPNDIRYED